MDLDRLFKEDKVQEKNFYTKKKMCWFHPTNRATSETRMKDKSTSCGVHIVIIAYIHLFLLTVSKS